ncbi:MAG: branched-chain amino acid ABC transporter permease [Caldimicrobium sp.]|nr:branched-chain amino acid ABC transporter permease [Caldimicrobium sp.]MCX7873478.1 branched-chain amino acid ABC transporter permease [Caldimicrobium sp.]MDW8094941.1 branched-chain amino acid ABC transporter permease [Caldimicrobium sp.]
MKKLFHNYYFSTLLFYLTILLLGFIIKDPYVITILIFAGLNALSALGLSLLMGLAGQISLGQNGFYGLGAYLSAIFALNYQIPVSLAVLLSALISSFLAIFLAIPALRLRGHYLAVATLGFGEIVYLLLNEWGPGGPSGFGNIPKLSIGGLVLEDPLSYLVLTWTIFCLFFLLLQNLSRSTFGKTLHALHSSEVALRTLGINILSLKLKIFIFSAFLTALSGALYAHFITFLSPANFSVFYSVLLLMMVMLGGIHTLWGAPLGALFITLLPEVLRPFKEYDVLIYGFILTISLIFFRKGIFQALEKGIKYVLSFRS